METSNPISFISMLLTQCGISSVRMFTPTFIYMLLIRYGGNVSCLTTVMEKLQANMPTPAWMNNDIMFAIFGVLAALELVANWTPPLRELLTSADFDKYIKVGYNALLTYGLINAQEANSLQDTLQITQEASFLPLALVGAACSGVLTAFLVKLRSIFVSFINMIDPDNDFHLRTLFVGAEESLTIFSLILVILLPILALIITLIVIAIGIIVRMTLKKIEESTNHLCPACGKSISSLAEICPECGATQMEVRTVGMFGLPGKKLIDLNDAEQLKVHRRKMLLRHRCPQCATLLHYSSCNKCHSELWKNGEAMEIVRILDRRILIISLVGLLINLVPFMGFPCFLISLSVLVMSPLRAFLNPLQGCVGKVFFTFLKVLFILIGVFIPYAGLLMYVPYGIYYFHSRKAFLKATSAMNNSIN